MPRPNRVDALGLGEKILRLHFEEGMQEVPRIQERILEEDGILLTDEQIRNYLKTRPAEIVEAAKDRGLMRQVTPILRYEEQAKKIFDDLEALRNRLLRDLDVEEPDAEETGTSDRGLVNRIQDRYGLDKEDARAVMNMVRRHDDSLLKGFLAVSAEARKVMELASKLDGKAAAGKPQPQAPVRIDKAVITGNDLVRLFEDARK